MGLIALLAGGSGIAAMIMLLHEGQAPRLIAPTSFVLIAGLGWVLLDKGHDRACLVVSTYGAWLVAAAIMVFSGGVRATTVITLPLIILMGGWLLGSRSAIVLSILSTLTVVGVAIAEALGRLPPQWPTSPFLYLIADAVVFVLSGGVIVYLLRAHRRHLEEVRRLSFDLARQRAEAAAADALRRHQDLLDRTGRLAHVGGWEVDVASRRLNWTAETFRIYELEPAAMPSIEQAISYFPAESRPVIEAAVAGAMTDGKGYDLELPFDTATGRRIWVRALCAPQFRDGKVVRLSGAFQDITQQRVAAEALRESLNNLQRTLEATDEGIFGYDGHDPSGKLLFANDRLFDIWKIPPEKRADTGRAEIIEAARKLFIDPDAGVRQIGEILAMGVVYEDKVPLNDGRVLFRRSIPLLEGSQVSRVWSFRDITAEERSKAELKASRDEAHRANAAKSEFLSRMSHELRTPLHAIMGMTAMARRRMTDGKGMEHLDKVKAAADHLLSVINDILDISKIEAGRMHLENAPFRAGQVIENVVNLIGQRASEKGLRLTIDCSPGVLDLALCGDPLRLGQILLNLVGNAVKFTETGTISIRVRSVAALPERITLRFEVEDTGIGISAADSQRLFIAFEQADGSMTRKFGGTGLGLAISRKLAELMGGDIGFEGRTAGGSCFWFTACFDRAFDGVPPAPPPVDLGAIEARLRERHGGDRLLLAEDEPVGREIVLDLLRSAGLEVDPAEDGAVALGLARRQCYDLILMDMQMPNLNGIDATRAIRADSLNRVTPIIALTANAFETDRRLCLEAGMNDYVSKPLEPALLFQTVLAWLDKDTAPPHAADATGRPGPGRT